jgi:hypothetical protein
MNSRARTLAGAAVLCALALAAIGTPAASAEGVRDYECRLGFDIVEYNLHCKQKMFGAGWITKPIGINEPTEVEGDSEAVTEMKATLFGLKVNITCAKAHSTGGNLKTIETGGGVTQVHGTHATIHLTECHVVLVSKPTRTCKVQGITGEGKVGEITTQPLTSLTGFEGAETWATVQPEEGSTVTEFKILAEGTECFVGAAMKVAVTGTAKATISEAAASHLTFSGTAGGELKANGATIELSGTLNNYVKGSPEFTIGMER